MNSFTNKKAQGSDDTYELIKSSTLLLPKNNSEMTSDLFTKAISTQPIPNFPCPNSRKKKGKTTYFHALNVFKVLISSSVFH